MSRAEKAAEILEESIALENGLEIPRDTPRYLGTEATDSGEIVWGYFSEYRDQLATSFEQSETTAVDRFRVYDLDTGTIFLPTFKVTDWTEVES